MKKNKRFKNLLFYLETCESGSMFYNWLDGSVSGILAHTAADPERSSYACDFQEQLGNNYLIFFYNLGTFLNDCWSRDWIIDMEEHDIFNRTVEEEYESVHESSKESVSCLYGDKSLLNSPLNQFMTRTKLTPKINKMLSKRSVALHPKGTKPVSSRDVVADILFRQLLNTKFKDLVLASNGEIPNIPQNDQFSFMANDEEYILLMKYKQELQSRKDADIFFRRLVHSLNPRISILFDEKSMNNLVSSEDVCQSHEETNFDCYSKSMDLYSNLNGKMTDYSLKYASVLYQLCQPKSGVKVEEIIAAMNGIAN